MKLIIQIPCYNEEDSLPLVIENLPKSIDGINEIETLVVDDGSTDRTSEVAVSLGVDHIVKNNANMGLSATYMRGLEAAVTLGADIIVNTDGDNQYDGSDIGNLVKPLLNNKADMVIGCRNIKGHKEFGFLKKTLQLWGSRAVRVLSNTDIPDTTSGFRAITRTAAIKLFVMNRFSYTLETLVQAGRSGLTITSVPVKVNPKLRESRLFVSNTDYVVKQLIALIRVYMFYTPLRFFITLAILTFAASTLSAARVVYYLFFVGAAVTKLKVGSALLSIFFLFATCLLVVAGLLGSVISGLRLLSLDIRSRVKNIEAHMGIASVDFEIISKPRK